METTTTTAWTPLTAALHNLALGKERGLAAERIALLEDNVARAEGIYTPR